MKAVETIIVGGGPAGSACAMRLKKEGRDVLVLDKTRFPRKKICAGWITPEVFNTLEIIPDDYPFLINRFDRLHFHILGIRIPVKTCQYAILRNEFDHWLLSCSAVEVHVHKVKRIVKLNDSYVIDDKYQCRYLVGAGGTHCPVCKAFFKYYKKPTRSKITAVEKEYQSHININQCHLWYFENRLPGYGWYLPKGDGWINVGIGGKQAKLEKQGLTILDHWQQFVRKLIRLSFIDTIPENPKGHVYYLFHGSPTNRMGNAFIVGDAAGLATLDMGEGICAAIKSGINAARSIIGQKDINGFTPSKLSLPGILFKR